MATKLSQQSRPSFKILVVFLGYLLIGDFLLYPVALGLHLETVLFLVISPILEESIKFALFRFAKDRFFWSIVSFGAIELLLKSPVVFEFYETNNFQVALGFSISALLFHVSTGLGYLFAIRQSKGLIIFMVCCISHILYNSGDAFLEDSFVLHISTIFCVLFPAVLSWLSFSLPNYIFKNN